MAKALAEAARRIDYPTYYYDNELERYLIGLPHLEKVDYSETKRRNVSVNLTKQEITEEVNAKFGSLGWYTYDIEESQSQSTRVENEIDTL